MHVVKVILTVHYDEATVDKKTIEADLGHAIGMAIDRGLLTPTGTEEIDEFSLDIHEE